MISNIMPVFTRGRVLKLEMLESLRDFPKDLVSTYFHSYSNGILWGMGLEVEENEIIISPGAIYFNGVVYLLREAHRVPYSHTNDTAILKVKFEPKKEANDFVQYQTQVKIDLGDVVAQDEMELCRFKLKIGAQLRTNYVDFQDMSTEFNTINVIHVPFACQGKSTLSPQLLANFAREAFQYSIKNPLDSAFTLQCLQQQTLNRGLITAYIGARLGIQCNEASNGELYRYLVEVLDAIKNEREVKSNSNYFGRKILIE